MNNQIKQFKNKNTLDIKNDKTTLFNTDRVYRNSYQAVGKLEAPIKVTKYPSDR